MYKQFSKHIKESFLTDDKKGEFASLVIDEQFIDGVAHKIKTSREHLIKNLCNKLYSSFFNPTRDYDSVIAIVAIQLYAASKCESDGNYSVNAYNPRLCEIIDCDLYSLQTWYKDNQERVWKKFYDWCIDNDFIVRQCQPKSHKNRFIQYPIELAKYLFNREDLKYIASIFNKYKLQPYENIHYSDFWTIINVRNDFKQLNNRIKKVFEIVLEDTQNYNIIKDQIFNYFLVWDGEYIDPLKIRFNKIKSKEPFQIHLSNKNSNYKIDIRKEDGSKISDIQINSNFKDELSKYYSYKRNGIIIFQKDKDGDINYWDETRFIEDKNESGLAIIFNNLEKSKFKDSIQLFHYNDIVIYEFEYSIITKEFYSIEKKKFELIGGLKITRQTYLVGGEPILRILNDCTYLINGISQKVASGEYYLTLKEGEYYFKFPKCREFKIQIVPSSNKNIQWSDRFYNWEIDKKEKKWVSVQSSKGIIGLDFAAYSKISNDNTVLKQWTKVLQNGKINPVRNVSLKLLNNINKHE